MIIEHNSRIKEYRHPFGAVLTGQEVTLKIALKDCPIPKKVELMLFKNNGDETVNMGYSHTIGDYNIYETKVKMPEKAGNVWYCFRIDNYNEVIWYSNNYQNLGGIGQMYNSFPDNKYQITVYQKDYTTPEWFKNSVCYQIFPDRFYKKGDFCAEKPHMKKRSWGDEPFYKKEQFGEEYDCSDFFGGNLKGIEEKLDYLKDLGIDVIYLNPIFEAYSNHRYDTGDYENIDPVLGSLKDFENLIKKADKMGIKIILDGVFNHTGSDSKYFNKNSTYPSIGAYQSKESPYYSWYRFFAWPHEYQSWWGIKTLPQIEENDESLRKYLLSGEDAIVKRWIKKGISGWRLDVADELPGHFIKELRKNVKKTNPDAVIIGEVWEDASNKESYSEKREYLLGEELDSVMNYPLRKSLIEFATGKINAPEFNDRIMSIKENYPMTAYYSLLNFLSSHDVERILTALSGGVEGKTKDEQSTLLIPQNEIKKVKEKLFAVMTLQILMPGVPCIYYGDEAGMQGGADPFSRRCYPWGKEDEQIKEKTKELILLRKSSPAFIKGEFESVYFISNAYAMIRRDGEKTYLVAVNFGKRETIRIDLARFFVKQIDTQRATDGIFYITLEENEAKVFECYQ